MAIIKNAAAVFVNLPTPFKASGQIQGQLSALQKPIAITHKTEVSPLVKIAPIEKQMPKKHRQQGPCFAQYILVLIQCLRNNLQALHK